MTDNWQTHLEQACTDRRFRQFVQQNALQWCRWRTGATRDIATLQTAPEDETPDEQAARWAAADELENNPRFQPAAVADDSRLTFDGKCALLVIWWYRERRSSALLPTVEPSTDMSVEPLQAILRTLDIAPDRAAIDFTDIGAIALDVLEVFNATEALNHASQRSEAGACQGGSPDPPRTRRHEQLRWLAEAMLLVREHPEWPDAEIARRVGKHPSQLSRNDIYKAAAKMARDGAPDLLRGHVTHSEDGDLSDVEAYAEEKREWWSDSDQ